MEALLGKWTLKNHENMDEYMRSVGVNFVLRKVGNTITNHEEISLDGDTWTISITSTFKNSKFSFKLGEEFPDDTMDGRKVKNTYTLDGNKLVCQQNATKASEVSSIITREVDENDQLVIHFEAVGKGVTAKRFYFRQKQ